MKRSLLLPVFAGSLLLAACSSSPMSRVDANRAVYESWPLEVQEAVSSGRVIKGMTPEQVEMALGKPSQVVTRSGRSGDDEVWIYRTGGSGSSLLNNTNISLGGGLGGVGIDSGPIGIGGGRNRSVDEQEVVFERGVVIRADGK